MRDEPSLTAPLASTPPLPFSSPHLPSPHPTNHTANLLHTHQNTASPHSTTRLSPSFHKNSPTFATNTPQSSSPNTNPSPNTNQDTHENAQTAARKMNNRQRRSPRFHSCQPSINNTRAGEGGREKSNEDIILVTYAELLVCRLGEVGEVGVEVLGLHAGQY